MISQSLKRPPMTNQPATINPQSLIFEPTQQTSTPNTIQNVDMEESFDFKDIKTTVSSTGYMSKQSVFNSAQKTAKISLEEFSTFVNNK